MKRPNYGVLLVNLGTPCKPTPECVRCFLKQFLSDSRVVDLPKWQWWPILNGIILNTRPKRVSLAYKSIWTEQGSPLKVISKAQRAALAAKLMMPVALGMTYCKPSIQEGLDDLETQGVDKVLVLPLFPQYSCSTTGAVFDAVAKAATKGRSMPAFRFVRDYFDHPDYIAALAQSVREYWEQNGQGQKLLISFHGVPKRYIDEGDLYQSHCEQTAEKLAIALRLNPTQWQLCYQSRFGKEPWLTPYTDETLVALPKQGISAVDVISPAFSVDCLETLEELAIEGKHEFIGAGGKKYQFIPCLNDRADHIDMMAELVQQHTQGWCEVVTSISKVG